MTGRLAITPDFAAPLVCAVPTPKATSGAVNILPALPGESAATLPGTDTLSEFAQLIQQIAGEPAKPQDAQPNMVPTQNVTASPERRLAPNQSGAAPAPALPPVPSARHGAKTEPAPAKPAKSVSTDSASVAVEPDLAKPPVQPSARPETAVTTALAPAPFRRDVERELPTPVADGAQSPAQSASQIKPEAAVSPAVTPVEVGRPSSPVNEMPPAVQPSQAPEPARGMPLKLASRPASPAVHAAEKQVAADQATGLRADLTTPRVAGAPTSMDVRPAAAEPAPAPIPPETEASPSPALAKSTMIPALVKPSLHIPGGHTPAVRQAKPASSEVKATRTTTPEASREIPLTVQAPSFVAPPVSPLATAPEQARHDTLLQPLPGVQRDAKPNPGPAAVELKIRPQDQPVDRIVPQMRAEPLVNSAATTPALHAAEAPPASAGIMQSIPNIAPAHANPNIVGVTPPPFMPQNPVAKPEAPWAPATHAADVPPDPPKQPTPLLRSISIDFAPDGAQDVHVHLAERAGDVHVSLHSADTAFAGRLADGVQDLVGTLAHAGYDAQAWTSGQERQNQRQQQDAQQQREDTNEGSEEFSAMMQQPNEEVS